MGLPCRLVRGSSYCGKEDDAMVVVKCGDDRYDHALPPTTKSFCLWKVLSVFKFFTY